MMSGDQEITSEHPALTSVPGDSAIVACYAVRTDTGLVRDHNEDDFIVLPEHGVYVVADGMGGHNAGSIASRLCVEAIEDFFADIPSDAMANHEEEHDADLPTSLLAANDRIFRTSQTDSALHGMGTTVVGVRLQGQRLTVSHAGDSRVYLFRNGDLRQLTADHSLSNFLRSIGRDAEANLAEATMSNVIMRALGLEATVEIESNAVFVLPGDRIILCSDGLSDLVSDDAISAVMMDQSLRRWEAAESLVELALDEGGRDNITVMIVDLYNEGFEPVDDDPAKHVPQRFEPLDEPLD